MWRLSFRKYLWQISHFFKLVLWLYFRCCVRPALVENPFPQWSQMTVSSVLWTFILWDFRTHFVWNTESNDKQIVTEIQNPFFGWYNVICSRRLIYVHSDIPSKQIVLLWHWFDFPICLLWLESALKYYGHTAAANKCQTGQGRLNLLWSTARAV